MIAMGADDLRTLAERAFQLALAHCGPCRDYHAVWPYLRLAHAVGGVEVDRDVLVALLHEQAGRAPIRRLAIAGSADTGLLHVALGALGELASPAVITVVDRCPTPLMLCRERRSPAGLTIATTEGDLREVDFTDSQDVVVMHSVLPFFPFEEHLRVLARMRRWLRPGGVLLLSSRGKPDFGSATEATVATRRASAVVGALADRGIPLPEPEPAFLARLTRRYAAQTERNERLQDPERLAALVAQAGFTDLETRAVAAPPQSAAMPYRLAPRMIVVGTNPGDGVPPAGAV